ncbi:sporulation protein YabP [Thermovenabulum gondwanense]|uniref:Spore protein YabP n=1 Tax=Thermovenabulum gondwanense TaxID=520767 RepID=A0A161PUB9_9FIRM|nr:sporulation protein YabP [Thermovenabulum gondwanense]KYO66094.1 Spore protein YabP [Thermovenabulum gondwanense]
MEEKVPGKHRLILQDRELLEISGVTNVDKFTESEILIDTVRGTLSIKGEKMHMKQLNLEVGNITIEGMIKQLTYAEDVKERERARGILQKLLR